MGNWECKRLGQRPLGEEPENLASGSSCFLAFLEVSHVTFLGLHFLYLPKGFNDPQPASKGLGKI